MRPIILLLTGSLIVSTIVGCVGINKARKNMTVYDFGLSAPNKSYRQITSKISLEEPVATESLNHNQIRYRLNYQNPSSIFFYTESRWATTPSELFSSKLNTLVNIASNPMHCSLKLKIEAFDHVFQTVTASEGIVQINALLIDKKSNKIISNQLITESITARSPNAQGGTAALQQASEIALEKAIDWGNIMAERNSLCQ